MEDPHFMDLATIVNADDTKQVIPSLLSALDALEHDWNKWFQHGERSRSLVERRRIVEKTGSTPHLVCKWFVVMDELHMVWLRKQLQSTRTHIANFWRIIERAAPEDRLALQCMYLGRSLTQEENWTRLLDRDLHRWEGNIKLLLQIVDAHALTSILSKDSQQRICQIFSTIEVLTGTWEAWVDSHGRMEMGMEMASRGELLCFERRIAHPEVRKWGQVVYEMFLTTMKKQLQLLKDQYGDLHTIERSQFKALEDYVLVRRRYRLHIRRYLYLIERTIYDVIYGQIQYMEQGIKAGMRVYW